MIKTTPFKTIPATDQDTYDTSSDTVMDLDESSPNVPSPFFDNTNCPLTSPLYPSSLQNAAHNPHSSLTPPRLDEGLWETPPPEILQEWKETSSKPRASSNPLKVTRGPPGRLSPPNFPRLTLSTNRYAVLQDLPLTRPPVTTPQESDRSLPTSTAMDPALNTSRAGSPKNITRNRMPLLRSQGVPIPRVQSSTPPDSPTRHQAHKAVVDFYATKRAKKGSPDKKTNKKRPSSPSSDEMSTGTKETEWTWTNDKTPCPPLPPTRCSHRHLLVTSENFDSDSDSMPDFIAHLESQQTQEEPRFLTDIADHDSGERPQRENVTNPTFHDNEGTEYNTILYQHSNTSLQETMQNKDQEENMSEATTILASEEEYGPYNLEDSSDEEPSPLPVQTPPSDSIQYKSPNADSEGAEG